MARLDNKKEVASTFYRMSGRRCPPLCLCLQPSLFIPLSLNLLYPQIVFMDGDTQHHLGTVLVDDKLVEVLPERLGRDVG